MQKLAIGGSINKGFYGVLRKGCVPLSLAKLFTDKNIK